MNALASVDFMPTWDRVGLYAGRPDLLYPGPNASGLGRARDLCHACPVLDGCRDWVLGLPFTADPGGVIAAMSYDEREAIASAHLGPKTCAVCGETKARHAFPLWSTAKPGRRRECRACWNPKQRRTTTKGNQ